MIMNILKKISIYFAVKRIKKYERYFDSVKEIYAENPLMLEQNKKKLKALIKYYESNRWLKDYQLDEEQMLPQNLKRGILSQDEFYNFIDKISSEN